MKRICFIVIFLITALQLKAKKDVYPIEVIAGSAELIVVGEIENVNDNLYVFKISRTLKGNVFKNIIVEMFEEWECDKRFGKCEKGQRLCLFLKKNLTNWTIINGSTGELLISNDSITLGHEEYKHIAYKFTPIRLPLKEFITGISDFCKCYEFVGNYESIESKPIFKQLISNEQILLIKGKDKFSTWLFNKIKKYSIVKE